MDLKMLLRPTDFGVVSSWFFCTVCRKFFNGWMILLAEEEERIGNVSSYLKGRSHSLSAAYHAGCPLPVYNHVFASVGAVRWAGHCVCVLQGIRVLTSFLQSRLKFWVFPFLGSQPREVAADGQMGKALTALIEFDQNRTHSSPLGNPFKVGT